MSPPRSGTLLRTSTTLKRHRLTRQLLSLLSQLGLALRMITFLMTSRYVKYSEDILSSTIRIEDADDGLLI